MVILLTIIHVIVCLFLIVVVLLQSGKAADIAAAFGGLGSQTVFGPRASATLLTRATSVAAALFMATSLTLSIMATRSGGRGGPAIFNQTVPGQQAPANKGASPANQGAAPTQTPAPAAPAAPAEKK